MVIFLYGPDDYRRSQKKKEIVEQFLKKHSAFGFQTFDFQQEGQQAEFFNFMRNRSLFDPIRLAVVESPFNGTKEFTAELKVFLEFKTITVLLVQQGKRVLKPFSFLIVEPVVHQEFSFLEGVLWKKFIQAQSKNMGLTLDDETTFLLSQVYQDNTWGLMTELEKLRLLDKKVMQANDLVQFNLEITPDFWRTVNTFKNTSVSKRLFALETLLASPEAPAKTFNILSSLWKEKITQCARLDLAIKSGKMDYEEALLALAIS